ncbi:MAG: hypothetical protein GTN39_02965 [Candidatus Aenigmarchaeota archaeon]|nr:hypothetical protein [Candidatus Aenigmarchaeota archaeon]
MTDIFIWISVAIVALILVILCVVAVLWKRRKGTLGEEPDYRAFFYMGLVWMIVGSGFMFYNSFAFNGLFALGFIFFIMGAANKNKWKKKSPFTRNQKMAWISVLIAAVIIVAVVALLGIGFV